MKEIKKIYAVVACWEEEDTILEYYLHKENAEKARLEAERKRPFNCKCVVMAFSLKDKDLK